VYNNRKGKGIHGAMKRAKSFMNSVGKDGYFLQLDIKGFFYNLDKNILFMQVFRDINKYTMYKEMNLEEIKQFLSVQALFVGHIGHANSYNLRKNIGVLNESNPFDYDRA